MYLDGNEHGCSGYGTDYEPYEPYEPDVTQCTRCPHCNSDFITGPAMGVMPAHYCEDCGCCFEYDDEYDHDAFSPEHGHVEDKYERIPGDRSGWMSK